MSRIYKYLLGSLGVIVMILFVLFFTHIASWIIIAVVIAMIGSPLVELLSKLKFRKFFFPRWLASLLTIVAFYFIIILFLNFFIPLIAKQMAEFSQLDVELISEAFDQPIREIDEFIHHYNLSSEEHFSIRETALHEIQQLLSFSSASNLINSILGAMGSIILGLFAVTFISFFFLKDKMLFDKGVVAMVPVRVEEKTRNALGEIRRLISRYFLALILEVFCMIVIVTLGLWIVGLNFELALLIGMMAGFFNIIPYLGPWIGAVLGVIMAIAGNIGLDFSSQIVPLVGYIVMVFAVAQLIDNIVLQPFIYSKSVKAHPLEIFIVILVAGSIGGIIGMMLAIPAYTVLRVLAKEFFNHYKFVQEITKSLDIQDNHK